MFGSGEKELRYMSEQYLNHQVDPKHGSYRCWNWKRSEVVLQTNHVLIGTFNQEKALLMALVGAFSVINCTTFYLEDTVNSFYKNDI